MNRIPNPDTVFPNEYGTSCFLKNVITAPNIFVGDYTYGNTAQFTSGISLNSNSREKHGSSCSLIRESIRLQAVRQGLSARSRSANANIILHLARCFSSPRYRVLRKRSCFLTTPNTCSTFARTEDFACSAFFASYWPLLLSFLI